MRAVTVAVDPVSGVGGYLKPGDHVDVVATFRTFGIDREAVARTVLQDVQLLALGSQIEKERLRKDGAKPSFSSGKDTATLLVTPAEAERLALAEAEGKLRLALRSAGDIARVDSKGITSAAVIGISASGEMGPVQRVSLVEQSKPTQTPERPVVQPTPPPKQQERLPATKVSRAAQPAKEQLHEIVVIRGTDVQKVQVSR
jgi:pilus assembly protein CpaB